MNTDLLNKALDAILAKPDKWNQDQWLGQVPVDKIPDAMLDKIETGADAMCGTTACLAGHVLLASGKYEVKIGYVYYRGDALQDYVINFHEKGVAASLPNYQTSDRATNVLDADPGLTARLFWMTEPHVTPEHFVAWVKAQTEAWPEIVNLNEIEGYEHTGCTGRDHRTDDCNYYGSAA